MSNKKYRTAITYGTYDLFHIGHLELIKKIRGMADRVIVAVSTDVFNEQKGKRTVIPFEQRIEIVNNIKGVDLVIAESSWEQKEHDIKKYGVDLFVIGDDWAGEFDFLKGLCDVKYLERTKDISSTSLKLILSNLDKSKIKELKGVLELAFNIASEFSD